MNNNGISTRLIIMNFLQYAIWGAYLTSMGSYLYSIGLGPKIGIFYAMQGIVSIFMPAIIGIIADKFIQAQKVLSICHGIAGIAMIAADAEGFVYCVSSLGVTGVRNEITTDISEMTSLVKARKDIPCAVGFGISTPEQAAHMAQNADGVIVGSAIVKICGTYGNDSPAHVAEYVKQMKVALK